MHHGVFQSLLKAILSVCTIAVLTFVSLLPGSVQVIFEHDADVPLIRQVSDEGVSQQGVRGGSVQMVFHQAAVDK